MRGGDRSFRMQSCRSGVTVAFLIERKHGRINDILCVCGKLSAVAVVEMVIYLAEVGPSG